MLKSVLKCLIILFETTHAGTVHFAIRDENRRPAHLYVTIKMRADRFVTPRLPYDRIFDCSGRRTDDDDGDTTTKVALIRPQFAASDRSDDPFQSYLVET